MRADTNEIWQRVESQRALNPSMYGNFDFDRMPERFTTAPDAATQLSPKFAHRRQAVLENSTLMETIRAYTMMGDIVSDRYAALMRDYGFRRLVDMLIEACDKGVENVNGAPPELEDFIKDLERIPDWLDMDLVEEGARLERTISANVAPFVIRGAFIATFMNKYSALPMAVTNTLSSTTAASRVKETATFFQTTVLPGAMTRFGPGFKAAAMVRLMHSMVRANVLRRPMDWDQSVFGLPIPQVDQMPAGLIPIFLMSNQIIAKGRNHFTDAERARVEMARYRCFLLGLPEDLLADTPQGIVDLMTARNGTLRAGFDDATCGALVRATMAADLRSGTSLRARIHDRFERAFSKHFFITNFMNGDKKRARAIGIEQTFGDVVLSTVATIFIVGRLTFYAALAKLPGMRDTVDRHDIRKIEKQLQSYGHAHFTTDEAHYRQAPSPAVAS